MNDSRIAYLGPVGTFAYLVASARYPGEELTPLSTIGDVFDYVSESKDRCGVVPIENSSGGTIFETVDGLISPSCLLSVQEEMSIHVNLALLGRNGEQIRVIYSHFAPFRHCDSWLKKHFPKVERQEVASTAEAARHAAQESYAAAISTKRAATIYGLDVLEFPIMQDIENVTQFFSLGHELGKSCPCSKSSLVVSLRNEPGSLCSFLEPFKVSQVDLSRIVSRPKLGYPNEYVFFIDVVGTEEKEVVRAAMNIARKTATSTRVVGVYPVLSRFES